MLDAALPTGPLVWGGDWNHALEGREYSGSQGGRTAIAAMLERRRLQVPTSALPHQLDELLSIDHLAVHQGAHVTRADRFLATGLSDHDGYSIEVVWSTPMSGMQDLLPEHPVRRGIGCEFDL